MSATLTVIDPKPFKIFSNERDLLRDLFTYLDYVAEHDIKRMTRTNDIPRGDLIKLAKLLNVDPPEKDEWGNISQDWIDFIDILALRLQLVSFDTKGEYRGYSSSEPSFTDNHIVVNLGNLLKFLELSPAGQEKHILETLVQARTNRMTESYGNNEFYVTSILGELDGFIQWGAGVGVMPTLKFPEIRKFLLQVLENCPPGQWFSTESLITYLKTNHRYFLIPEHLPAPKNKWETTNKRYGNFHEGTDRWRHNDDPIPDDAPDGFERVEGRYVERFLEFIPLVMRFVDVAYDPEPYQGELPSRGKLKAFRVNERFPRLMREDANGTRVTVQPNFDVVIESDFYPAKVIRQINDLGELVSTPNSGHGAYVGIYQLKKSFVAATLVQQPDLDVSGLLKELSGRELPGNVQIELDEWAGHAEQFTLYEGFALLESPDLPLDIEKFTSERIAPGLNLVRNPEIVFSTLETLGYVPVRMEHAGKEFTLVAAVSESRFPKESDTPDAPKVARPARISKVVTVSYRFAEAEAFEAVKKVLAELRCPFTAEPGTQTVNIQQKEQARFDKALANLADEFAFEIE